MKTTKYYCTDEEERTTSQSHKLHGKTNWPTETAQEKERIEGHLVCSFPAALMASKPFL